jgi:fatty-acyl-CoA synthase
VDINWIVDAPFEAAPVGDRGDVALVIDAGEAWTYGELRDRRDHYVAALLDRGVTAGERVGILMLNSLDYIAVYFAAARIGAIAVRLNFRLAPAELEFILNDSGCTAVVLHTSRLSQLAPIREKVAVRTWLALDDSADPLPGWVEALARGDGPAQIPDLPRPAGSDPLMLMYTSGTTGRPKGVLWTHDNALWVASMQAMKWGYTSRTVAMTVGPLYHAGAFELLLLPALLGHGTAVMMSSGGMSNERIVDALRGSSVTHVLLYPFLLYGLLEDKELSREDLGSVEAILVGGDPVLPWALQAVESTFPGVQIQQGYGLTEATMSTCLDHVDSFAHPDSVGRPMPLVRIRIVRVDGTDAEPDEVGEVWISSPAVAHSYWNNPVATEATFVEGWCRTGDLGKITADGFIVLTGREKDMIRSGGENIYPAEVEAALASHAHVDAVAVIAVPDAQYIEVGAAVVVRSTDSMTYPDDEVEAALREHTRTTLAGYKCPRYYVFVEELPISASGKLLKQDLRDAYRHIGTQPGRVPS